MYVSLILHMRSFRRATDVWSILGLSTHTSALCSVAYWNGDPLFHYVHTHAQADASTTLLYDAIRISRGTGIKSGDLGGHATGLPPPPQSIAHQIAHWRAVHRTVRTSQTGNAEEKSLWVRNMLNESVSLGFDVKLCVIIDQWFSVIWNSWHTVILAYFYPAHYN